MGNIEYLVYITKAEQNMQETDPEIIVKNAHKELGENE
jgi:hypothetical protein